MSQISTEISGSNASLGRGLEPDTVILDGSRLLETKRLLRQGDDQLRTQLCHLTAQADRWLEQGPWSVTNKVTVPPGGDKHDYASQAPYWWPSSTVDGLPYIQRDGMRNPEVDSFTDFGDRGKMFRAALVLSLAWYYTENAFYAKHASNILRTWFLQPETRMNPNLNHAQIIPGANTGRFIGIIDFSHGYTSVLDAAAILAMGAPGWTKIDMEGFYQWNVAFLDWLQNSDFGIEESAHKNNHGTFALMQKAAIAAFVGNNDTAKRELLKIQSRIDDQIQPDGSQPEELARTRSWHYSTFNLVAYTRAAAIGRKVGVDLWGYIGPQGQSIHGAVGYLIPAATGLGKWQFPELDFASYAASDIVQAAADAGNSIAKIALSKLQSPPEGDLWALRPAVEQLDPVRT